MRAFTLLGLLILLAPGPGFAASSNCTPSMEMGDMSETMERIRATEDIAERERMLETHLEQMHAKMAEMHCMMGEMMGEMNAQRTETKRLHDHRKAKHL